MGVNQQQPLHGCQTFSLEAANNVRKVVQFRRQMFKNRLFKSSPNAVVSMTGPTAAIASRLKQLGPTDRLRIRRVC